MIYTEDNTLTTCYPKLRLEWHPTKNGNLTPYDVTYGSNKKVWWICSKGHEWKTKISQRSAGSGCPYCVGLLPCEDNCLATVNPKLAKEWHPTKNGNITPYDITPGSGKKVWWICSKGHEWESRLINRASLGHGCAYCSNKRVCEDNCLATINPGLSKEWHPTKNGDLTPYDVAPGSTKKVWWICGEGHEWESRLVSRHKNGAGCSYCSGRKKSKSKRILFKLINIWDTKKWPYATAGKLDVCDMIMTELDCKGYTNLNFLSLPGNGREIHELNANGFSLNYSESLGVEKYNVTALREYFLSLFKRGELQGLLPIVRANIDDLVIRNEYLPKFNSIHLDYNGPLIQSHILAVEAALRNNPDAVVAITVNRNDRYKIAVDYKYGEFPFITMNPELLFYQPYEGKKPMPWREGAPMETYCFQNRSYN